MVDRKDGPDPMPGNGNALAEEELELLFAEARAEAPAVPGELTARVLADALSVQEDRQQSAEAPRAPRRGPWAALMAAIGGVPALAGLAAATLAGVWIGISPPAALADTWDGAFGTSAADPYLMEAGSAFDFAVLEYDE